MITNETPSHATNPPLLLPLGEVGEIVEVYVVITSSSVVPKCKENVPMSAGSTQGPVQA